MSEDHRIVERLVQAIAAGERMELHDVATPDATWFGRPLTEDTWPKVMDVLRRKEAVVSKVETLLPLLRGLTPRVSAELLAELEYTADDNIILVELQLSTRPVSGLFMLRNGRLRGVYGVEALRKAIRQDIGSASTSEPATFSSGPLARFSAVDF